MNFRKGSKRQLTPTPNPQNGPYLWKSCACISHYLAIIPPCIYATISIIKNLQHNFPKMRRGGSKVVWNCSKNSSDLVYFHTNKDLGASYVPLNIYLDDTWHWEGSKKCHKPLSWYSLRRFVRWPTWPSYTVVNSRDLPESEAVTFILGLPGQLANPGATLSKNRNVTRPP